MSAPIGNVVQCGVYMVNSGSTAGMFAIPCSGDQSTLGYQNDVDDFFLVYPGWKVHVRANADANSFLCDNTNGSTLVKFNSLAQNQASNFRVYYMGVEIIPSTGTATTLTW